MFGATSAPAAGRPGRRPSAETCAGCRRRNAARPPPRRPKAPARSLQRLSSRTRRPPESQVDAPFDLAGAALGIDRVTDVVRGDDFLQPALIVEDHDLCRIAE